MAAAGAVQSVRDVEREGHDQPVIPMLSPPLPFPPLTCAWVVSCTPPAHLCLCGQLCAPCERPDPMHGAVHIGAGKHLCDVGEIGRRDEGGVGYGERSGGGRGGTGNIESEGGRGRAFVE